MTATTAKAQTTRSCTDVEIDGRRVPSYDCLSQLMTPRETHAGAPALSADAAQSAMSNRAGLYNASALQHRMGSNLGKSVYPWRPVVSFPTPILGGTTGK